MMNAVVPNLNPQETNEERLRRLTKTALGQGTENAYGPKPTGLKLTSIEVSKTPKINAGAPSNLEEIMKSIMKEKMHGMK